MTHLSSKLKHLLFTTTNQQNCRCSKFCIGLLKGTDVYRHRSLPLLGHPASVDVEKLQNARRRVSIFWTKPAFNSQVKTVTAVKTGIVLL
jgi:hypothetical protein